jgi:hypothetical protein
MPIVNPTHPLTRVGLKVDATIETLIELILDDLLLERLDGKVTDSECFDSDHVLDLTINSGLIAPLLEEGLDLFIEEFDEFGHRHVTVCLRIRDGVGLMTGDEKAPSGKPCSQVQIRHFICVTGEAEILEAKLGSLVLIPGEVFDLEESFTVTVVTEYCVHHDLDLTIKPQQFSLT